MAIFRVAVAKRSNIYATAKLCKKGVASKKKPGKESCEIKVA